MGISGIHHATLIVDDEDRAAWFYGQVLGLSPKPRPGFKFPGAVIFFAISRLSIASFLSPM